MKIGLGIAILSVAFITAVSSAIAATADDVVCTKCVGLSDIAKNAVAEGRLAPDAVSTIKIQDGAVTMDKLDAEVRVSLANSRGPVFVGFSSATFNGSQGVAQYTNACQADFPGSHMCTSEEFLNTKDFPVASSVAWIRPTFVPNGSGVLDASGVYSIDDGRLSCEGWNQWLAGYSGLVVSRDGRFADVECWNEHPVACCR